MPRKDNTNVINYFIHFNFWTTQIFEVSTQKKKKKKAVSKNENKKNQKIQTSTQNNKQKDFYKTVPFSVLHMDTYAIKVMGGINTS